MAGEAQDNVWPLPSFYFKVELGSLGEIAFKEVSGLDMEAQVIEYRHGFLKYQDAGTEEDEQCQSKERGFQSG